MASDVTRRKFLNGVAVGAAAMTAGQATYFAGPRPPLRLLAHERVDEDVIRLTYVPA